MTCPLTVVATTTSSWHQEAVHDLGPVGSCLCLWGSGDPRWQLKPDAANKFSKDPSYENHNRGLSSVPGRIFSWQQHIDCWTQHLVWDSAVSHQGTLTAINTTVLVLCTTTQSLSPLSLWLSPVLSQWRDTCWLADTTAAALKALVTCVSVDIGRTVLVLSQDTKDKMSWWVTVDTR